MKNIYTYFLMLFALCIYTPTLAANEQYPLEAPDTSSPRATLESFQTLIRDMKPIVGKVRTSGLTREIKRELRDLRNHAMRCLNLSQVPKRLRDDVGPESIVLLAEILRGKRCGKRDAGRIVRILIDQVVFVLMCNGLAPFYRKPHSRGAHFQPLGHLSDRHTQLADSPKTE